MSLNLIENLWVDLKRAVYARRPENTAELEAFCKKELGKIPNIRIERLLTGYKKRLQALISARGDVAKH